MVDAENPLKGFPLGPEWEVKLRVSESGARNYVTEPPGLVSRFWPWPAGFALFMGLSVISDPPSPLVYFVAGAGLVALRNELRMQTVRQNYESLLAALERRDAGTG